VIQTCKHCNSENSDNARFCEQCGQPLNEDAIPVAAPVAAAAAASHASVAPSASKGGGTLTKFAGLIVLVCVLGLLYFLLKPEANPADATAGGAMAGGGQGAMKEVLAKVAVLKDKLKKNPGDVGTVAEMYGLYSQVGKTGDVTPHLDKALKQIEADPKAEVAKENIATLAQAALSAGDDAGLLSCLLTFQKINPDEPGVLGYLGDLTLRMGKLDEALDYYNQYLGRLDKAKEADEYWAAIVSRANARVQIGKAGKDPLAIPTAISELTEATTKSIDSWSAWYYLGEAQLAAEDKTNARASFVKSQETAGDGFMKWQSEAAIARLDGKPEPPMPNPHGAEMGSPHGGDMGNPHGGGGAPGVTGGQVPDDDVHKGVKGGGGAAPGAEGGQVPDDDIHKGVKGAGGSGA
jgi:tetratricopeptide (TPR) repeat protein